MFFSSFIFLFPDEVYCRETKEPEVESWSMSDLPVIVLVVLLLLAILVGLGCALRRFLPCLSLSLQNNYISYTFSLLSSPFYCLNILIFILIFIFLSFSFVFNIGFSHIFLLGIFVRHLPNFPGTVFSFFHVTSFHFFSYICW